MSKYICGQFVVRDLDERSLGRDPVPVPPCLLLLTAAFGPFLVGEDEPGPPALDPVMALGAGGLVIELRRLGTDKEKDLQRRRSRFPFVPRVWQPSELGSGRRPSIA